MILELEADTPDEVLLSVALPNTLPELQLRVEGIVSICEGRKERIRKELELLGYSEELPKDYFRRILQEQCVLAAGHLQIIKSHYQAAYELCQSKKEHCSSVMTQCNLIGTQYEQLQNEMITILEQLHGLQGQNQSLHQYPRAWSHGHEPTDRERILLSRLQELWSPCKETREQHDIAKELSEAASKVFDAANEKWKTANVEYQLEGDRLVAPLEQLMALD